MSNEFGSVAPKAKYKFFFRLKSNEFEKLFNSNFCHLNNSNTKCSTELCVIDETDSLPERLCVTYFDLFCYSFSIFTYIMDVFLDIAVAYLHFCNGRVFIFFIKFKEHINLIIF